VKKILVSLPEGIMDILNRELKGKIGTKDSEVIRAIVIAYLSEKGYLSRSPEVDD
jgi:metal-responsive CopG/Arc/MetJ family transcriptional regulator